MPLSMSTLNSNFGRGFTLSKYYGTPFSPGNAPTTGAINYNAFVGKNSFYNYVYPTGFTSPLFVFDSMSVPCTTTSSSNTDGRFSQCNWYYYSNNAQTSTVTPTNPSYNTTRKTLPLNGNWLSFNLYDTVVATPPITGWNTSNHTVIMILYWVASSSYPLGYIAQGGGVLYDIGRFGSQSTQLTGVGQHIAGDTGYWTFDSSAGTQNASLLSLTSNKFVMVSVVKSSSPTGSIVYYKNATQVSSNADTKVCSGLFFIGIDQRNVWFGGNNGALNAELAYCGVWNTALTAAQISNFYMSNIGQFGLITPDSRVTSPASATLITWFKGDSGLTTTAWTNNGTNGGSATLTSSAVGVINAQSAADFTGSGAPHGTFTQNFTGQPRAIFVVIKFPSDIGTTSQHLIAYVNGSGQGGFDFVIASGTQLLFIQQGQGVMLYTNNMSTIVAGKTYVLGMVNSATVANNRAYQNGTSLTFETTNPAGSPYAYNTGTLTMQLNYYNGSPATTSSPNYICEVLCYNGELVDADCASINTYLKAKWGVT